MNYIDAFLLLGGGYTCGNAAFAGYGAHKLKSKVALLENRPFIWMLVAMANGLTVGFVTIFAFVFLTICDKPGHPDFLSRAVLFTIGHVVGMYLVFNYFRESAPPSQEARS